MKKKIKKKIANIISLILIGTVGVCASNSGLPFGYITFLIVGSAISGGLLFYSLPD